MFTKKPLKSAVMFNNYGIFAVIVFVMPIMGACSSSALDSGETVSASVRSVSLSAESTRGRDDSKALQKLIDQTSAAGGGEVVIPAGRYGVGSVQMRSGVDIRAQEGVTLFPVLSRRTVNMFECGDKDNKVVKASFSGPESRVIFDVAGDDIVPDQSAVRAFGISDCENFRIANVTVNDKQTTFSSIILGWSGEEKGVPKIARNGVIENFTANNAHYGYGAIQAHAGDTITFRNIKSVGGVAVRLETGLIPMNRARSGGLYNIEVENIISQSGQAALMTQPHTIKHGKVRARNIVAEGSEFAVLIAKPFVSKTRYRKEDNMPLGSYESLTIDGVKATYTAGPIITRYPHLKYYPVEEVKKVTRLPKDGNIPNYRGGSIAAVGNMDNISANISVTNVEAIGFEHHPAVIYPKDLDRFNIRKLPNLKPVEGEAAAEAARIAAHQEKLKKQSHGRRNNKNRKSQAQQ